MPVKAKVRLINKEDCVFSTIDFEFPARPNVGDIVYFERGEKTALFCSVTAVSWKTYCTDEANDLWAADLLVEVKEDD